jgi:hypothetical protein
MTAAVIVENKPDIQERVAELKSQILAVQEQLEAMLRGAGGVQVILPELHDKATGRIDTQKVALYMGVPLKRLAEGLQLNYKAVHRNPSASALQSSLKPVKRSLEILHEFFNKPETVRIWLNTPHPDLDGSTALYMILANNANAVLRILENAAAGVPV